MSASIKAGLNNDMHLMTDGVTRAYIDSDGNVGIGTSSPSTTASGYNGGTLHMHNTGTGSSVRLTNTTTGTGASDGMLISKWSDRNTYFTNFDNDAETIFTQSNNSGTLSTTMKLNGSGYVTKPNQPCVWVTGTGDYVAMNNELMRFTVINHQTGGSNYNTSSKLFTCPVAGWYECSVHALTQSSQNSEFQLKKNGTTVARRYESSGRGISAHNVVYCSANDTLGWFWASTGSVHYQGGVDAYSSALYRLVG